MTELLDSCVLAVPPYFCYQVFILGMPVKLRKTVGAQGANFERRDVERDRLAGGDFRAYDRRTSLLFR